MASKTFLVTNLVQDMQYDLCVLAIWDDTATTLTATNVVGCVQFITRDNYPQCQSLQSQFLGGTMIDPGDRWHHRGHAPHLHHHPHGSVQSVQQPAFQ